MRVITGNLGGRRLKSVPGKETRPTSDKIKEAVFQMIGPYFQGGSCLDLFAGSGSLGIEAISRGMDYGLFIDKQRKAIQTIKTNINLLNIEEKTEVSQMDARKALHITAKKEKKFDLILIDPPYEKENYSDLLNEIIELSLLKEKGIIYCEHTTDEQLPDKLSSLRKIKEATYGSTTGITIYQNNDIV